MLYVAWVFDWNGQADRNYIELLENWQLPACLDGKDGAAELVEYRRTKRPANTAEVSTINPCKAVMRA